MKATKEKGRQSFEYVEVEGNMFKLEHVVGDGNCFFHSISKSPYVSANHTELRFMLVDYIEAEMVKPDNEIERLYNIFGGDHDVHHWLASLKRVGSWAGSCAAVYLCRFININVRIITNARKFLIVDTRLSTRSQGFDFVSENAPTVNLYHHVYKLPFTSSDKCNHFAYMWEVNKFATIDKKLVYYGGGKTIRSASNTLIDCSENENKKQKTIDLTKREKKESADLTKREKKESASVTLIDLSKKENKRLGKKTKQSILSTWVIAGTEQERSKLIQMQETNAQRSEFESKIEEFVHSNKNQPPPVIQCVTGNGRHEKTWNERAQRIYVYLHPELANNKMTILRWAYPSLRANTFKNWLKRHEMISKWIPMIKLLKGEDVINNVENDEAKERFHQFFTRKCSIDIRRYEIRLKETPNVVLVVQLKKTRFGWLLKYLALFYPF